MKKLFLFAVLMFGVLFSPANALEFLNLTEHTSWGNNTYVYVEESLISPNGTYTTHLASYSDDYLSKTKFAVEIWANVSNWSGGSKDLSVYFKNVDNGKEWTKTYTVYLEKNFINTVACAFSECIYLKEGTYEGNNTYSYIVYIPISEVADNVGDGGGFFGGATYLYGNVWSRAEITEGYVLDTSVNLPTLSSLAQLEAPEFLAGSDIIYSVDALTYKVKWRSIYHPYDIGVAIVDNNSLALQTAQNWGYLYNLNEAGVVAVQEKQIAVIDRLYDTGSYSIADMSLVGEFSDEDFNQPFTDGDYYIIVFQKSVINGGTYYNVIGWKEFTYNGGVDNNLLYTEKYSFDIMNYKLYANSSVGTYWLKFINISDKLDENKIQSNYLDILVWYYDKSGNLQYADYSVVDDYLIIKGSDIIYNNRDDTIYFSYGSSSPVSTNDYYVSSKDPQFSLGASEYYVDVIDYYKNDNFKSEVILYDGCASSRNYYYKLISDNEDIRITGDSCPGTGTGYVGVYITKNGNTLYSSKYLSADKKLSVYLNNGTVYCDGNLLTYLNMSDNKYLLSLQKSSTYQTLYITLNKVLFDFNFLTMFTTTTEAEMSETYFYDNGFGDYEQGLNIETAGNIEVLKIYVDNEIQEVRGLSPSQVYDITVKYHLANGKHTLTAKLGDIEITHDVYVTDSNNTENVGVISSINNYDISTYETANRGGSTVYSWIDEKIPNDFDKVLIVIVGFIALGVWLTLKVRNVLALGITAVLGIFVGVLLFGGDLVSQFTGIGKVALAVVVLFVFGWAVYKSGAS